MAARWPPLAVTTARASLQDLRDLVVDRDRTLSLEAKSALARFLVVRSVGYVEQTVQESCRGFATERSGGWVRSFALSWLERTKNPTSDNLQELLGRFDAQLESDFDSFLRAHDERHKRDLAFMVDRRNRIAHGLNESINADRAVALCQTAQEIADWFVMRLNPDRR